MWTDLLNRVRIALSKRPQTSDLHEHEHVQSKPEAKKVLKFHRNLKEMEHTKNAQESLDTRYNSSKISGGGAVYVSFMILGLSTLLPWNFLITAESYWMYKFRNTTVGDEWRTAPKTSLQNIFTPMEAFITGIMNLVFLIINLLCSHLISNKLRITGTMILLVICFVVATAFIRFDTDSWQLEFFVIMVILIFVMNACSATFQGSVFGVAAMFPLKFINAVVIGQAISGIFVALARIVSIYMSVDPMTSAFIYFVIAITVVLLTLVEYLLVSRKEFFKFYAATKVDSESAKPKLASFRELMKNQLRILKTIWPVGISVCFLFAVTISIHPAVCVRVVSTHQNKLWADTYFQPVATFLLYSGTESVTQVLAQRILWPPKGSQLLYVFVFLRAIFIPLILLCNHGSSSLMPSVFTNDIWYISFIFGVGTTQGYCLALCMMYAPKMVPKEDSERAGSLMTVMIGLGLFLGATSSFLFSLIVSY